jgi:allantoinase
MDELADCGVVGYKAFMCNSGIEDFSAVDDEVLYKGMIQAARLQKLVAVHAEDERLTGALAQQAQVEGRTGIRAYLNSRPVKAELDAIRRAIALAEETGCALHIVHVSSGSGVALVAEARARGSDISCETCPHYLVLTEDDVERLGAVAKCSPPLRDEQEQALLWEYLQAGHIQLLGSDHSPSPASMKRDENFFRVWGGISGCQSLLSLLLTEGYAAREVPLPVLASLLAEEVARRFQIPQKGRLAVGLDADLVLADLEAQTVLQADDLYYRHRQSPYTGRTFQGKIVQTLVRGVTVYKQGYFPLEKHGQLLRPEWKH